MKDKNFINKSSIIKIFEDYESIISILISIMLGLIILVSFARIIVHFYTIFISDIYTLNKITYKDYQILFGKILTLFISFEFLHSIINVIKDHDIKSLVLNVMLISALAIGRKLIIYDYSHGDPLFILSIGGLLVCIGIAYYLIKFEKLISKADNN